MSSRSTTVLLLSDDTMTLALLGMLVELASFIPVFAAEGELPEDALSRTRPSLVVLLDDTLEAVSSDIFFARAAQRRVALAIFPGKTSQRQLMERIGERGIPYVELPTAAADLAHIIRSAAGIQWWSRGTDRRALPASERANDGGLFFVDRAGLRWEVYDRRGSERRAPPNGAPAADPVRDREPDAPITRVFTADNGTSRATQLIEAEITAVATGDLERQFLRATPVG